MGNEQSFTNFTSGQTRDGYAPIRTDEAWAEDYDAREPLLLGFDSRSDMDPAPTDSDQTISSATAFETDAMSSDEIDWDELEVIEPEAVASLEHESSGVPPRQPYPELVEQPLYIAIPTTEFAPNGPRQIIDTDHFFENINKTVLADVKLAYVIPTIFYKRSLETWNNFNNPKHRHFVYVHRQFDLNGEQDGADLCITRNDRRLGIGFVRTLVKNGATVLEWKPYIDFDLNPEEQGENWLAFRRAVPFGNSTDVSVAKFPSHGYPSREVIQRLGSDERWSDIGLKLDVIGTWSSAAASIERILAREILLRKPWEGGRQHVRCGKRDWKIFYPYTVAWGKDDSEIEEAEQVESDEKGEEHSMMNEGA